MLPTYDHYRGSGPTLVFLHYWGGSARTWQPVIERLPGRDAVAVDARGWGRSRELPGPYTLEQSAQDTAGVIAEAGLREYVLVGHSMGGKVAQLVAATRPAGLTGLVLVAPGPAEPPPVITAEYQQALSRAYDSVEGVAGARDHVLTATPLDDGLKAQVLADSRDSGPEARACWPLHGIAQDVTARTREIEVPVLVVAGEHDRVEPVDALRAHLVPYLHKVDLVVIPGSGHLIPLEAPDALARAISAFAAS
ncbi:alpha/beta fold hydrolase [Actinoplanes sp. NPDC020271]|uniref:alpha/beta fold hydrolase n=1 Tax=Actinoplanes sp. NPDC020271 TaxID=3363896 RepID=UPI00378CECB8